MRGLTLQRQQQPQGTRAAAGPMTTTLRRVLQARPAALSPGARPRVNAAAPDAAAAAATTTPPDAEPPLDIEEEERRYELFRKAFRAANTMSQLYNIDRPPPVPLEEFEQRRRDRETGEVVDAAKRLFNAPEAATREALAQLESLVPGLLDLSSMTAREFALLASDVNGAVARIVGLRVAWPRADVGRVLRRRPRMLLPPGAAATLKRLARGGRPGVAAAAPPQQAQGDDEQHQMAAATRVAREAASIRLALSGGSDPAARAAVQAAAERAGPSSVEDAVDAVIEAAPELMDPLELSRALAFVRASFPSSTHPAALVAENPALLLNLGESNVEDSAEYGEITTRF